MGKLRPQKEIALAPSRKAWHSHSQDPEHSKRAARANKSQSPPTGARNKKQSPSTPPEGRERVPGVSNCRLRPVSPQAGFYGSCSLGRIPGSSLWDFSNVTADSHREPLEVLAVHRFLQLAETL